MTETSQSGALSGLICHKPEESGETYHGEGTPNGLVLRSPVYSVTPGIPQKRELDPN